MSQAGVMKYLKKCKKPKTAREIAEALGTGKSTINMNLKKLRGHDDRIK